MKINPLFDEKGNPRYTNLGRNEIPTKSVFVGLIGETGEIAKRTHEFHINVGAYERWKPSMSRFIAEVKFRQGAADAKLTTASNIAVAKNCMNNPWQYVYLYAGKNIIDGVKENYGEVSQVKTRLEKSNTWFKTYGRLNFWDLSFKERQNLITSDPPDFDDDISTQTSNTIESLDNITNITGLEIADGAVAAQSLLTFVGTTLTATNLRVGDLILFNNATHGNNGVTAMIMGITNNLNLQVSPRIAVSNGAGGAGNPVAYVAGDINVIQTRISNIELQDYSNLPLYNSRNTIQIPFKLALGTSDLDEMPPGEYRYKFKGYDKTQFARLLIESTGDSKDPGNAGDFDIDVIDWYYLPYIVESPERMDNVSVPITFKCYAVDKRKVLTKNEKLQFTIDANADSIGFGLMDSRIGSSSLVSVSKMIAYNGVPADITRVDHKIIKYQIKYASKIIPLEPQEDNYGTDVNQSTSSYTDSFLMSGGYFYDGTNESYDEWLRNGRLFYHQLPRDKNSYATEAQLNLNLFTDPGNTAECCLFWTFYKSLKLNLKDGKIISINEL